MVFTFYVTLLGAAPGLQIKGGTVAGLVHFWDRGLVFSLCLTWKVGKLQED